MKTVERIAPRQWQPMGGHGFTLIELMIAVAIVGILAAIAYPAYTESVLKGRRAEARAAILDLMQQQERYMTQTGCYGHMVASACTPFAAGATGTPFKTYSGSSSGSSAYTLGARACAGLALRDCVQIFATPAQSGDPVGELNLTSAGQKNCALNESSPSAAHLKKCWP